MSAKIEIERQIMQGKKTVKKPSGSSPKPTKRGRPPVEFRKKSFHILLDPRYIAHFRKKARELKMPPQILARMALNALIPDPFNPATVGEITRLLSQYNPK